ncbi:hypothetical protein [uncultured Caulobacter sp.]|jgi:hypothetical protein|uniref:hypothetical protein n=1 Tax=uncultured Caulobacter sp. TaxID=158749 RepID=UPI00262F19DE|nr:hypothetical protein [uncultured Caulobacter sp.]
MSDPRVTLVLILLGVLLVVLGYWAIGVVKRSRRSMAPIAGMMLLLGAFFTADPPPPPPAESATPRPDEADEPKEPPTD